jgi:Kelch motif/Galactose oxidase, central domain
MQLSINRFKAPAKPRFIFSHLFLGVIGSMQMVMSQSPGNFTATGSMTTPRANHTATLLLNGKVLIAGGFGVTAFNAPVVSAEIYDPTTGTFTSTGNMTTVRTQHNATLLADGRVLITGGRSVANGAILTSAELYDPSTGTFTAIGERTSMSVSRGTATLLGNGKVLITGGPTATLYDPATGTFTATLAYAGQSPEFVETATLLPDSRVLLTGEAGGTGWAELYDPGTGTFSLTGPMIGWDELNTATLLTNGKVLFLSSGEGDGTTAGDLAGAEIYDPATGAFNLIGFTTASHEFSTNALLPNGTVLITGGQLPGGNGSVSAEIYAGNYSFYAPKNMTTARHDHTATLLPDGTVLIAGGFSSWPYPTSSAEIYQPQELKAAPVLFSLSHDGRGQGAIWHTATGEIVSPDNPGVAGEALSMYTTSLVDGGVIPPNVAVGGRFAEIIFFGNAPGHLAFNQVNFTVPSGMAPSAAVPVRLTYLGRPSNEVTIGLR